MRKIGLVLILIEIVALIIMSRQTAYIPNRPMIDAIQLQQNPIEVYNDELNASTNFIKASLFPNPTASLKTPFKMLFTFSKEKSVALAINSQ